MAVITQNYDIDLKATGEYPVVKMSQFDTGSRTIVFTVYDGHDLARLDGMVARVDGTRNDGVEFSSTCTVSTGSKVSFTISQEMTKTAGKHAAELVIFDAGGNPIGTQNFVIDVEAAPMVRDSAASADDRTLYDQYTDSVGRRVDDKIAAVDEKIAGIDKQITTSIDSRITPDQLLGAWCSCSVDGTVNLDGGGKKNKFPLKIKDKSDGAEAVYGVDNEISIKKPGVYHLLLDGWYNGSLETDGRYTSAELSTYDTDLQLVEKREWKFYSAQGIGQAGARTQIFRGGITFSVPDDGQVYYIGISTVGNTAVTLTESSKPQIVITRISGGSDILENGVNTLQIGTTTTGAKANVVNSGTAKDVVLDFTLPSVKVGAGLTIDDDGALALPASANVALYGIPTDGSRDVADDINNLIKDNKIPGVYFPAGIYKISKPIELPYNTDFPFGFEADAGAVFVATQAMSDMLIVGAYAKTGKYKENFTVRGGTFECAAVAQNGIRFSPNVRGLKVSDVCVNYAVNAAFIRTSAGRDPFDTTFSNIRINYVDYPGNIATDKTVSKYGFYIDATDWQLDTFYASSCLEFINTYGAMVIDNAHFFNYRDTAASIGIRIKSGWLQAHNLYFDTMDVGVSTLSDENSTYGDVTILATNVVYYEYGDNGRPCYVFDVNYGSRINVTNVRASFKTRDSATQVFNYHKNDGTVVDSATNLAVSGINASPDSPVGIECYSKTPNSMNVFDAHRHVAGDGVQIGWIPMPGVNDNRAQQVILTSANCQDGSSVPTRIVLVRTGDASFAFKADTLYPYSSDGNIIVGKYYRVSGGGKLFYGVKPPVTDANGRQYCPLYLYNSSSAAGWCDSARACLFGSTHGITFRHGEWESGLKDSDFLLTTATE